MRAAFELVLSLNCKEFCAILAVLLADCQYRGQRHLLAAPTPPTPPTTSNINKAIMVCLPTVLFMLVAVLQACEGLLQLMVHAIHACMHSVHLSLVTSVCSFELFIFLFCQFLLFLFFLVFLHTACIFGRCFINSIFVLLFQACSLVVLTVNGCSKRESLFGLMARLLLCLSFAHAFHLFIISLPVRPASMRTVLQSFTHPSARIHFFRSLIRMRTKSCKWCALEAIGTSQVTLSTRMAALASRIWAKRRRQVWIWITSLSLRSGRAAN